MKNNKAWAAAVAQALVQLVAAFVPFEPDLEQALGVVLTAGVVWLVPNIEHTPTAGATVTKTPVKASMPAWTMAAALALGLLVSACAALGDKADLFIEENGVHCCHNYGFRYRTLMIDWMTRTL